MTDWLSKVLRCVHDHDRAHKAKKDIREGREEKHGEIEKQRWGGGEERERENLRKRARDIDNDNDNVFIEFRPSAQSQGGDKVLCTFKFV